MATPFCSCKLTRVRRLLQDPDIHTLVVSSNNAQRGSQRRHCLKDWGCVHRPILNALVGLNSSASREPLSCLQTRHGSASPSPRRSQGEACLTCGVRVHRSVRPSRPTSTTTSTRSSSTTSAVRSPLTRLSFCWRPLYIHIETPAKGRGGCSRKTVSSGAAV